MDQEKFPGIWLPCFISPMLKYLWDALRLALHPALNTGEEFYNRRNRWSQCGHISDPVVDQLLPGQQDQSGQCDHESEHCCGDTVPWKPDTLVFTRQNSIGLKILEDEAAECCIHRAEYRITPHNACAQQMGRHARVAWIDHTFFHELPQNALYVPGTCGLNGVIGRYR